MYSNSRMALQKEGGRRKMMIEIPIERREEKRMSEVRLIDGNALTKEFLRLAADGWNQGTGTTWARAFEESADVVECAPTIDPAKRGKWLYLDSNDVFECSVCGRQMVRNIFYYCPWCGARMRGEE